MRVTAAVRRLFANQYDVLALQALQPLAGAYLPLTGASMRPAALLAVVNDLVIHRRRSVAECGSGVSTVLLARALREQGGTLVSVEHDETWLGVVRGWLEREKLEGTARLVHAPLIDVDVAGTPYRWYDPSPIEEALGDVPGKRVDLLLVDGPPAGDGKASDARYPALPLLGPFLQADATVILDDAGRRGERRVVARWQAESELRFEIRGASGGIAIGRAGAAYLV